MARILIVDDAEQNLLLYQLYLKGDEFDVETARSGREALALVSEQEFDLISVRPGSADPLVLKIHFDARLSVDPPLEMTAHPMPDGDPGFIRVEGHEGKPFEIRLR